jgi:hypothetical protein
MNSAYSKGKQLYIANGNRGEKNVQKGLKTDIR